MKLDFTAGIRNAEQAIRWSLGHDLDKATKAKLMGALKLLDESKP